MKSAPRLLGFISLLWLQSLLVSAAVSDASVDRLLRVSGLEAQVNYYPAMIKAGLDESMQQGGAIPEREYQAIISSVDKAVVPAEIIEGIRFSLKSSLSQGDLDFLLAWYQSRVGKIITSAEEAGATPQAYTRMQSIAGELLADKQRLGFARRLDEILGLTDFSMSIQESTSIAVYAGVLAVVQPHVPLSMEQLRAQVRATLDQNRAAIEEVVLLSSLYSYRHIDMESLKAYEAFLKDPRTVHFNQKVIAGLGSGLENAVSNMGVVLGKELLQRKP